MHKDGEILKYWNGGMDSEDGRTSRVDKTDLLGTLGTKH